MPVALTPYVPRLVLTWAEQSPRARYRRIDGTMVFCDVSGFTALSERLARKGKVGAEELTDILNTVFSNLLERAATYGGSMLKYGGDAVLVFFWGDDHARRGTAAAAAMRAGLRAVGRGETESGKVRLRMSVGVHSGAFDFFLVGESHRELVVAGEAATATCAMEASASAGEILISAATAAALPRSSVGAARGDGFLLKRAPSVAAGDPTALAVPENVDAAPFVPAALRDYLAEGEQEAEHRQATIAFIAFGDVDQLITAEGGEAVAQRLQRLMASVQQSFDDFGITFIGSDIYADGGKVIAIAGAPIGWPNNDERMLRALRKIVDSYDDLPLHIGVNRGYVFTGDVGPRFRRTYTMLGDAVNTAARVMARADRAEIRTMPAVTDRSETTFETRELEPFTAKGKAEPLVTLAVGPITGRRVDASDIPLVGRDDEVAELLPDLEAASGGGRVIDLIADSGMGKTRLVRELVGRTLRPSVWATCEEYEATTPYFALRPLIRAALDLHGPVTPRSLRDAIASRAPAQQPWSPLLAAAFSVDVETTPEVEVLSPSAVKSRFRRVLRELATAAYPAGAVFVIDDAHWIDAASADVVAGLAQDLSDDGWAVLFVRRPDIGRLRDGVDADRVVKLQPLTSDAALALARAAVPSALVQHLAFVAERSDGHPLFALQLAYELKRAGSAEGLPEGVEEAITARIDALPPHARATLRMAAVLGSTFDVALLRELEPAADIAEVNDFVERINGVAKFRQSLFQQVAYEGLPFRKRRLLHAAAARLLEAQGDDAPLDQLSRHFDAAQDHAASWEYSRRAAESAADRFAPLDAAALYRRAANAGRRAHVDRDELATVLNDLGLLALRGADLREASIAYDEARRLSSSAVVRARLCLSLGEVEVQRGDSAKAMRWWRRALRDLPEDAPDAPNVKLRVLGGFAGVKLLEGAHAEGIEIARDALSQATDAVEPKVVAHLNMTLGVGLVMVGKPEDATDPLEAALATYDEVRDRGGAARAMTNLAMVAQMHGNWTEARLKFERSAELATAAGEFVQAAATAQNSGEILLEQGFYDEARVLLTESLSTFVAARHWYRWYVLRNLGMLEARAGNHDLGAELLAEARAGFCEMKAAAEITHTDVYIAEAELLRGATRGAMDVLDILDLTSHPIAARAARLRGTAMVKAGQRGAAGEYFELAIERAMAIGDAFEAAIAASLLAELQGDASAASEAHERLRAIGIVVWPTLGQAAAQSLS